MCIRQKSAGKYVEVSKSPFPDSQKVLILVDQTETTCMKCYLPGKLLPEIQGFYWVLDTHEPR